MAAPVSLEAWIACATVLAVIVLLASTRMAPAFVLAGALTPSTPSRTSIAACAIGAGSGPSLGIVAAALEALAVAQAKQRLGCRLGRRSHDTQRSDERERC